MSIKPTLVSCLYASHKIKSEKENNWRNGNFQRRDDDCFSVASFYRRSNIHPYFGSLLKMLQGHTT